jgi:hypothetical protein
MAKRMVFDKRKPIYKAFGDYGIQKTFQNRKMADRWAKSHNGVVLHVGWKLKKVV